MTTSCCLVPVIALVKRQLYIANILGGVEGRVCLAMSCFIFGTLLTEHGFKKRYSESGFIVSSAI